MGRSDCEKDQLWSKMVSGIYQTLVNRFFTRKTSTGVLCDGVMVFKGGHGRNRIDERNLEGGRLLKICDKKEVCVAH